MYASLRSKLKEQAKNEWQKPKQQQKPKEKHMKRLSVYEQKGIIMGNQKRVNTDNIFFFSPNWSFWFKYEEPSAGCKAGFQPKFKRTEPLQGMNHLTPSVIVVAFFFFFFFWQQVLLNSNANKVTHNMAASERTKKNQLSSKVQKTQTTRWGQISQISA